jgi:hypothetical protein
VSAREQFERVYAEVCEAEGWVFSAGQVDVKLEGGRHQVLTLDYFAHESAEMVRFHTTIGSTTRIRSERLTAALNINFSLPHGSLAVKDEMLLMVDTLMLADADPGEVRATLSYLAETADYYERTMFGPDAY